MSDDTLVSATFDRGLLKRAYEHADSGAVYETLEIPMPVVQKLGLNRIASLMGVHHRRLARWKRNAEILRELEAGTLPKRLAQRHDLSVPQIYRIQAAGRPDARTMGAKVKRPQR